MNPLETLRARLASLLSTHDTSFDYSDDHRVWLKGMAEYREIQALRREIAAEALRSGGAA